jgi:heavy metal sensor kinase
MIYRHVSISMRLTAWFGGIFFLGWLCFGALMWYQLKHTLNNERYQTLSRRVSRLQEVLKNSQDENPEDRTQEFVNFANATGNGLSEILNADGTLLYPSPSAAASKFQWPAVHADDNERFVELRSGGQDYWVLIERSVLNGKPVFLTTAAPEASNQLVLNNFRDGLLSSIPVLLLISTVGGYLLSRAALRPVDRITSTARSISIRNLSERVPTIRSGDELQRLTDTCNEMLSRLESAVNQIKQFTADASHELRGPLTFVRTVSEVGLRNPEADAHSRQAFRDIVEETVKASHLLEDMLALARLDAERMDMTLAPIDINRSLMEAFDRARPIAEERGLNLSLAHPNTPIIVLGDASALRQLFWSLFDNAIKYTPSPGVVDVAVGISENSVIVTIHDSGIGISAESLPHIFNRFYRADPSRSQVEGSGLGLAIAQWIAYQHHASLTVDSAAEQGTTFRVTIPLAA